MLAKTHAYLGAVILPKYIWRQRDLVNGAICLARITTMANFYCAWHSLAQMVVDIHSCLIGLLDTLIMSSLLVGQ